MSTGQYVFLADDHAAFRQSTRFLLEALRYVVREFGSAEELLAYLHNTDAQRSNSNACVLLDVHMGQMSGLQVHDELIEQNIDLPVVYMTGQATISLAVEAMAKGAVYFLEKPFSGDRLKYAIDTALAKKLNRCAISRASANCDKLGRLTCRERQVLQGLFDGHGNKRIALLLGISIKTVEMHRANLMRKMQAKTVAQLAKIVLGPNTTL